MNEFFIKNRLHDYADNALSPQEKIDIDLALPNHPELMQELKDILKLREMMIESGGRQAPSDLFESIWLQTECTPIPSANTTWPTYLSSVGLAFAVLLVGWFTIPQNPTSNNEEYTNIKGARTVPSINIISLPTTSPIEQATKDNQIIEEPKSIPTVTPPSEPSVKRTPTPDPTYIIPSAETPYFSPSEQDVYNLNIEIKDEQPIDPELVSISFAHYRLLFTLQNLAKENNGRLLSNGVEVTPFDLSGETPSIRLSLEVPDSKVSKIYDTLRQEGGTFVNKSTQADQGNRIIDIDVRYVDH